MRVWPLCLSDPFLKISIFFCLDVLIEYAKTDSDAEIVQHAEDPGNQLILRDGNLKTTGKQVKHKLLILGTTKIFKKLLQSIFPKLGPPILLPPEYIYFLNIFSKGNNGWTK